LRQNVPAQNAASSNRHLVDDLEAPLANLFRPLGREHVDGLRHRVRVALAATVGPVRYTKIVFLTFYKFTFKSFETAGSSTARAQVLYAYIEQLLY
jgi:hypothetical protein